MRKTLLDISGKIDPFNLKVLKKIIEIAASLNINFFLVGATVRDMLLNYCYGIKIYRATNDIDFAVRVRTWDEYYKLAEAIEKAGFKKDIRIMHRYYCEGLIIDFIPFGEIAGTDNCITWPDNEKKIMSMLGFNEAYINCVDMLIESSPPVTIKTASVESLVMLKLFAWDDREADLRIKDAKDLFLIITSYLRAGNEERLFSEHPDIVEQAVDYELSGARLLGRDIKKMAGSKIVEEVIKILSGDKLMVLAGEMAQYEENLFNLDENNRCVALLRQLVSGLIE